MTNNFQNALPSLSPDKLAKLGSFLDELIAAGESEVDDEPEVEETKTTKRRQRQKARSTDPPPRTPSAPARAANPPKKKIILESEDMDDLEEEEETPAARSPRRGKKGGKLCRVEPVRLSGVNKFEQMEEKNAEKHLIAVDKKSWKDRTPTPRSTGRAEKVAVRCRECKKVEEIPESLVYYDPDTHKVKHTCDGCLASRR